MTTTIYVAPEGLDSNSGLTSSLAKETIAAAVAALPGGSGIINISEGHHRIASQISITGSVHIIGAGKTASIIEWGTTTGYAFYIATGSSISDITFQGVCIDMKGTVSSAGIRAEKVKNFSLIDCEFRNPGIWSVVIGCSGADADSTVKQNSNVNIKNCTFNGAYGTYEALLVFNTIYLTIDSCDFFNIGGSSIGIGFYQNVDSATISNCTFAGVGSGGFAINYTFSCNNITICDTKIVCGNGISGAKISDHGTFGYTWVDGLRILRCDVKTTADARSIEIGGCRNARIVDTVVHDCQGAGVWIGKGALSQCSLGTHLVNTIIKNNNQIKSFPTLHPAVFIDNNVDTQNIGLTLYSCQIYDDQKVPTQTYAFRASPNGITGYLAVNTTVQGLTLGTLAP